MITTVMISVGTRQLKQTQSDTYLINKVGTDEVYASAVDVLDAGFEYVETAELLPVKQMTNAEMLEGLGIQPNKEEM